MSSSWKSIPFEGCDGYEVSDDGRVRHSKSRKERSLFVTSQGYVRVTIRRKTYYVHRLVMAAHNPEEYVATLTIDHVDRDPSNNRVDNLRAATMKTQRANSGRRSSRGVPIVRIDDDGEMTTYATTRAAARANGIPQSSIVRAASGKYADAGGFRWVHAHSIEEPRRVPGERWTRIGTIEVSDAGRVRTIVGNSPLVRESKDLCIADGYPRIRIEGRAFRLHRLVAIAFVPRPSAEHDVVNHKDGDKTNAAAVNLEWTTVSANARHMYLRSTRT